MAQAAVAKLLCSTPGLDPEDLINGHCETVACATAECFLQQLSKAPVDCPTPVDVIVKAAYTSLAAELTSGSVEDQVATLFAPQKRAEGSADGRGSMWHALAPAGVVAALPGPDEDFLAEMCAGARPTLKGRIEASLVAAAAASSVAPFAVPLYVLNYIWDGDELTAAELREDTETACYSVHAIGLVLDPTRKVALLADPNGPLMRGGSMEFLAIPVARLPRGQKPTTAKSQWDRDAPKRDKHQLK